MRCPKLGGDALFCRCLQVLITLGQCINKPLDRFDMGLVLRHDFFGELLQGVI